MKLINKQGIKLTTKKKTWMWHVDLHFNFLTLWHLIFQALTFNKPSIKSKVAKCNKKQMEFLNVSSIVHICCNLIVVPLHGFKKLWTHRFDPQCNKLKRCNQITILSMWSLHILETTNTKVSSSTQQNMWSSYNGKIN